MGHEISKSARKRAASQLQDWGVELAALPAEALASLDLPENLLAAVQELRRLTAHGAQLRQRQYIGKLMRRIDAAPIHAALAARKAQHDADVRALRRVEQWRDALLRGEAALTQLESQFPGLDAARVQELIARSAEERSQGRPPRAARELFSYLRELVSI